VSLLKSPDISCVVSILHTLSFKRIVLSKEVPSSENFPKGPITAVDLICLFKGEPVWVIASARNPRFVTWETSGGRGSFSSSLEYPGDTLDALSDLSIDPLDTLDTEINNEKAFLDSLAPSNSLEGQHNSISSEALHSVGKTRATHDICLKDRITGLLDAASQSSDLLRPAKIVLYFARGLQRSILNNLKETFGARVCPELEPLALEIEVKPQRTPNQITSKDPTAELKRPLGQAAPGGKDLVHQMAPDSEVLAWSLIEPVTGPNPTLPDPNPVSTGPHLPGSENGWIVVEEPKPSEHQKSTTSCRQAGNTGAPGREESYGGLATKAHASGGADRNGVMCRVKNAVQQLEQGNRRTSAECKGRGPKGDGIVQSEQEGSHLQERVSSRDDGLLNPELEGDPSLVNSFVAVDALCGDESLVGLTEASNAEWVGIEPASVDGSESVLASGQAKQGQAGLENGWIAIQQGGPPSEAQCSPGEISPNGPCLQKDRDWVALSPAAQLDDKAQLCFPGARITGDFEMEKDGAQWVGVSRSEEPDEMPAGVARDWVGIGKFIAESEDNVRPERMDLQNSGGRPLCSGDRGKVSGRWDEDVSSKVTGVAGSGTESSGTDQKKSTGGGAQAKGQDVGEPGRTEGRGAEQSGSRQSGTDRNRAKGQQWRGKPSQPPAGECTTPNPAVRNHNPSGKTPESPAQDNGESVECRFRAANQIPLTTRPTSWPVGLELVNLDTTALVAFVSGMTNGEAEALRGMPEREFKERWKGNARFMYDQVRKSYAFADFVLIQSMTLCRTCGFHAGFSA
jgi:hypothetical protein